MKRVLLHAKIHGATVTEANVDYLGSLTLDRDLMDAADLCPFERIEVYNITGGQRFSTYVIEGSRGGGQVCVNGAAAHLARPGDSVIITAYCQLDAGELASFAPLIVFVDAKNRQVTLQDAAGAAS